MNNNIVLGIAILAIAISIGTLAATSTDTEVQQITELKADYEKVLLQLGTNEKNTNTKISKLSEKYLTIADFEKFKEETLQTMKGEIIELQAAKETQTENFIELPERPTQRETLNLMVTDFFGNPKEVFGINEPVIIKGDQTPGEKITYTIYAPSGSIMVSGEYILDPLSGEYYVSWQVPSTPEIGTYSVTFSNGSNLDSITFIVQ